MAETTSVPHRDRDVWYGRDIASMKEELIHAYGIPIISQIQGGGMTREIAAEIDAYRGEEDHPTILGSDRLGGTHVPSRRS